MLRTQKCTPKPVSWLTLAFRMVKLRVVGNACPPVLLVWKMKAKLNPAKILLFLRLALVPPMLKLVKELPVSTRPPVVLMPISPPLIRSEKPELIVIVRSTLAPFWTKFTVPIVPETPRLLVVKGKLLAEATGTVARTPMTTKARIENLRVAIRTIFPF